MRVLITTDAEGGVWTYALDLCRGLTGTGVEVTLAVIGKMSPDQRADPACVGVDLRHRPFALEWMPDPWRDVDACGEWLQDIAEEVRPDIVHLNCMSLGSLGWGVPTVVVVHSCVASWWEAVHGQPPPSSWDTYRRRVAEGLAAATVVVAPTAAMLDETQRLYGLSGGTVIHNGADGPDAAPTGKERIVCAAGRAWDRAKNMETVERIQPPEGWRVVIAGDGTQRAPSGPVSRVERVGRLSRIDLMGLFARTSIFVHPARYEPFGLAPLEAALRGSALILGDIPSLREVWGEAAVYVDPDDPQDLQRTLDQLARSSEDIPTWSEAARSRALEYPVNKMSEAYLRLYRELVGTPQLSRRA